ncbi:hypothetical protein [Rickettsia endosymbiont of Aspidapion aeneum]|uniref:hypothetical protein n=1 Tax=Rickettsia endosymbiont of Aspidapion aeneum TaxID=3066247 RepID=UPI00313E09D3
MPPRNDDSGSHATMPPSYAIPACAGMTSKIRAMQQRREYRRMSKICLYQAIEMTLYKAREDHLTIALINFAALSSLIAFW